MYMKAFVLAMGAHEGQLYGDGRPYIHHCVEVCHTVQLMGAYTEDERCVAILHDTIEDSDIEAEDLKAHGFSKNVVDAVVLLTKDPELTYFENIQRIVDSGNITAMRVKFADNTVNHSHCGKDRQSQRQRYDKSMIMLARAIAMYTQKPMYMSVQKNRESLRYENEKTFQFSKKSLDASANVA